MTVLPAAHLVRSTRPAAVPGPTTGGIDQVEIQLGHLCNNRCVFCASGFITDMGLAGQEDSGRAFSALAEARAAGARKVTFLGGEPTLQRDFPGLLARARELGFEKIVVFTNGVRSQQRGYLEELLRDGPLTFRISIQGGTETAHDRVVGRKGAFRRIVRSMELLNELGQEIECNACLNVHSYRSVEGYPELVRRYGIGEIHLDQVNPHEIGNRPEGYIDSILVRHSEQAGYLGRMLAELESTQGPGYAVTLGNIPYCVMPEWAHRIRHGGEYTPSLSSNLGGPAPEAHDKYERKTENVRKATSCGQCVFDSVCIGVYGEYADAFGLDELRPVSPQSLRSLPSGPEMFTLLEWDALCSLRDSEPPAGTVLESVDLVRREPEAKYHYGVGQQRVTLAVRHPQARGAPVAVSERLAVHLQSGAFDAGVAGLVSWAFERLRQPGDRVLVEPAPALLERRARWGALCRADLARLVQALASRSPVGRFRTRGVQLAGDGESATLLLADGERALAVRLVTQPPFQKPRVRAVFPRDPKLALELRTAFAEALRQAD